MNGGVKGWSTYKHKNLNSFALNERVYTLKGLISGFLLGSISLALYSIIIGFIAPKSPESFNVETIYSSQFSNSETSGSPQNISLDNFNYKNFSFYLDSECKVLPVSKYYTARRLIITGNLDYYSNSELCNLYSVIESNEFYKSLITQINVQKNNTILITRIKNLEVNIGNLDRLKIKFENLMTFYNRIVKFKGWDFYDKVNLKYIDQIICSKK